jgi:hypothetical protein
MGPAPASSTTRPADTPPANPGTPVEPAATGSATLVTVDKLVASYRAQHSRGALSDSTGDSRDRGASSNRVGDTRETKLNLYDVSL